MWQTVVKEYYSFKLGILTLMTTRIRDIQMLVLCQIYTYYEVFYLHGPSLCIRCI